MASLSKDSYAILLLCSDLAMPKNPDYKPFSLKEWQLFSHKLKNSSLERPESFFSSTPDDWRSCLSLSDELVCRLQKLLGRAGQLGIELERLGNMGIWVTTRAEDSYPVRLKKVLMHKSPVVLFGAGDRRLLQFDGVAIVGSREVDREGATFAEELAKKCTSQNLIVVSGGANGVDSLAQESAIKHGGKAIAVLADGLESRITRRDCREAILDKKLLLLSSYHPKARFKVYTAMERNKYIYGLAKYAVVVSSSEGKGGTWAGATETLRAGWVPVFVRSGDGIPEGNKKLVDYGAIPMQSEVLVKKDLRKWFEENSLSASENLGRASLFREDGAVISYDTSSFEGLWPYLEKLLAVPRSYNELSVLLNVPVARVKKWLKEALEQRKVKKLTRPVRFISLGAEHAENFEQKSIFDFEADYGE